MWKKCLKEKSIPIWQKNVMVRPIFVSLMLVDDVHIHHDESESHNWDYSFVECFCWVVRILFYEDIEILLFSFAFVSRCGVYWYLYTILYSIF